MFDLYRKRMNCNKTDKQVKLCEISANIDKDFLSHPNYYQIYKNFNEEDKYDVLIHSGDAKERTVAYKQLLSYPYDEPKFNIGDYIHWEYGDFDINAEHSIWLLLSCDKQYQFSVGGRMYQCENELKFIDKNGVLQKIPSYIEDKLNETQPDYDQTLNLPKGTIFSYIQYNDITKQIRENRRFLIGNRNEYIAYKTHGLKNFSNENLVRITLYEDQIDNARDDISNGIANAYDMTYSLTINSNDFEQIVGYTTQLSYSLKLNDEEVIRDILWTTSDENIGTIDQNGNIELLSLGSVTFTCSMKDNETVTDSIEVSVTSIPVEVVEVKFNPTKTTLLSSEGFITYEVYKYANDIVQTDAFNITLSGANEDNYNYSIIDDNHFSIQSLGFDYNKLEVLATSQVDGANNTINIQLKNEF